MPAHDAPPPHRGGLVAKRTAILTAARDAFGREGYAGASIEKIATRADVSTRTIYNHFVDKEALFTAVVTESAATVVRALGNVIQDHLSDVTDIETHLIELGRDWVATHARLPAHFALVRQLEADTHVPTAALDAWHAAGPQRAQQLLAHHLGLLGREGHLSIPGDPATAANHFIWLVAGEVSSRTSFGMHPLPEDERGRLITSGVRTFLHGYAPRRSRADEPTTSAD